MRYILDTHSQIASPGEVELGSLCARLEDVIRWTQPCAVSLNEPTDVSLAEKLLGWRAEVGLEEGLRRMVDWWRAERAAESAAVVGAAS